MKEVKDKVRVSSSLVEKQFNVNERPNRIEAKLKGISEPIESIEALTFRLTSVEKDTACLMKLKGLK